MDTTSFVLGFALGCFVSIPIIITGAVIYFVHIYNKIEKKNAQMEIKAGNSKDPGPPLYS